MLKKTPAAKKKSDADSSTDTIVEWTKNTPKPDFFE